MLVEPLVVLFVDMTSRAYKQFDFIESPVYVSIFFPIFLYMKIVERY